MNRMLFLVAALAVTAVRGTWTTKADLVGRARNLAWDEHETCAYCDDTALVVIGSRRELVKATRELSEPIEELGPCPMCARGYCVEFAYGRRRVMRGTAEVIEEYQGSPPWGKDGFWASRLALRSELRPLELSGEAAPSADNEERAREMVARLEASARGLSLPLTGVDVRADMQVVAAQVGALEVCERGLCGDCGEKGERVRYGRVLVCRGCAAGRLGARLRLERGCPEREPVA